MRRVLEPELMDEPGADPGDLARSLEDLRRVNRWLGGRSAAIRLVLGMVERIGPREVRILDVGTGAADLPVAVAAAARRRGMAVRITATDLHPRTVAYARAATRGDPSIEVARADVLALPYAAGDFDLALCATALHHFGRQDAVIALRELNRVAVRGVVVTDLARSRAALLGARFLAATVWRRHPITRHDGPASVRAAFTPHELTEIAREAVGEDFEVRRTPVFRLALVIDRTGAR